MRILQRESNCKSKYGTQVQRYLRLRIEPDFIVTDKIRYIRVQTDAVLKTDEPEPREDASHPDMKNKREFQKPAAFQSKKS